MSKDSKQFWMVAGMGPSQYRHSSRLDAEQEARRLSSQHPGHEFYVLEAIVCYRKVDVERTLLRRDCPDDDIPF